MFAQARINNWLSLWHLFFLALKTILFDTNNKKSSNNFSLWLEKVWNLGPTSKVICCRYFRKTTNTFWQELNGEGECSRCSRKFRKIRFRSSCWTCSKKKVFSEISQNSQKNSCARVSSLMKFFLLKMRLWCFPVNFAKFLRTTFLQNTSRRLPLSVPFEINKWWK